MPGCRASANGRITRYPRNSNYQDLTYDAAGRVVAITDSANATLHQSYDYDALDRLVRANAESFAYDAAGNRTLQGGAGGATSYGYAADSNRLQSLTGTSLVSFSHDPAGRITSDGARAYRYNSRGLLTTVTIVWGAASATFAANASGTAAAVIRNVAPESLWLVERAILNWRGVPIVLH